MGEVFTNKKPKAKRLNANPVKNREAYNPDEEFQKLYRPWDETILGGRVNEFASQLANGSCEVNAKLYEFDVDFDITKQYTKKIVRNREQFIESMKANSIRTPLREGDSFSMGCDNPSGMSYMTVNHEYLPLMGGPYYKQLYLYGYLDMHRKCFEAWNHNPVAHTIVNLTTNFILGRGVKGVCKNQDIQDLWDEFWEDNNMDSKIRMISNDLCIYGEVMVRCFTYGDGAMLIREIDPSTVWEIVTEPDDIETVYYYHQQYSTAYQLYTPQDIPITQYIIRQIPANEMIHRKINCVSNEKRGRSDLFSVLGWLKMLKDYYTSKVVRAQIQCNFVHKVTLKGSDSDVATFQANLKEPPQPGAYWIQNESFDLEPMAVSIGSGQHDTDGEMLLTLIATGVNIPKEFLGLSQASTRATALVASEPSTKKFQDRQAVMESILTEIYDKFLDALGEQIAGIPDEELDIEFTFPEIASEDRSSKLKDLALAESMDWVSKETIANIAGKELQITTYDYDEEKAQIAVEKGEEIALAYAQTPKGEISPASDNGENKGEPTGGLNAPHTDTPNDITTSKGKSNVKDELRKK